MVFSDASLTGLGVVVFPRYGPSVSVAAPVPAELARRLPAESNLIYVLEIAAALLAISFCKERFNRFGEEFNLFLFVDNNASLAALVRASSSCALAAGALFKFWKIASENNISPWHERVSSSCNPADRPSRFPNEFENVEFPVF